MRTRDFLRCGSLLLAALFLAASGVFATPRPAGDSKRLSAEAYVKALERFSRETGEAEKLEVIVDIVPDVYLLAMAKAFKKLEDSGYDELEIEKRLTKVHQKIKKNRGKVRLGVSVSTGGFRTHYFLQGTMKTHLTVSMGKKKGVKIAQLKPQAVFGSWKIYELDTKRKFNRKLARMKDFTFEATTSTGRKSSDKDPITLTLSKIRRYVEPEKRSEFERLGINVNAKQIALPRWKETEHPAVTVTILPGKWKMPVPPKKLQRVLTKLWPKG